MNFKTISDSICGNIVPVPGQFNIDLSLNLPAYRDHISFLLERDIKVFYLAHSASEFGYMTQAERLQVTREVAGTIGSNGVLLAQAVGGTWIDEQVDEAKMLFDAGVHAVVVMPAVGVKEGSSFFNCKYIRGSYAPDRHDDHYVAYMTKFAEATDGALVYHDKLFSNKLGLSYDALEAIAAIDNVVCLKLHMADPCARQAVYSTLGQKVASYDGLHKPLQLWSLVWGASGRHTNYAWFDPDHENKFYNHVRAKEFAEAIELVNKEWPLANVIRQTGYRGFKEVMAQVGLPSGPVRMPGEDLNDHQVTLIEEAIKVVELPTW